MNCIHIIQLKYELYRYNIVKPQISQTSKESSNVISLSDNGILQIISFLIKWLYGALLNRSRTFIFIFANIEIYTRYYRTHWKIVKTTFDQFFWCMAQLGLTVYFLKFTFTSILKLVFEILKLLKIFWTACKGWLLYL